MTRARDPGKPVRKRSVASGGGDIGPAGERAADAGPKTPRRPGRPVRRAPGRPARDAGDLKAQLIDAALACFVEQGIAATSIRDIATRAGVTPALLHYYFGDKTQLQAAVVEQRLLPVFENIRAPLLRAEGIAGSIAAFVNGVCTTVERHPWLPPLWVREVVSEGGALRDLLVTRFAPEVARTLARRFGEAQAAGRLNPDLDPRLLMVSLVGLTLFPAAGAPIWRQLFDAEELGMDDVRRHALALLDRGLELG